MEQNTSRGSVLLVEDDFVLRAALAELLAEEGYSVDCAANGLEALGRLQAGSIKPSVIVLDLVMPYMDGVEFRTFQLALPKISDVPVVVITASGATVADTERLGLERVFFKPLDTQRLLATLAELAPQAVPSEP